jgi:hypothetical protein
MLGWVRGVGGVLQAGIGMLGVVLLVRAALLGVSVPLAPRFVLCVAAGAAAYALLILWRAPAIKSELRVIRERVRPSRRPSAPTPAGSAAQ